MKLYYMPGACSIGIHVLLEEIGKPYDLQKIDGANREQYGPAFVKLNPKSKVPTLQKDDSSVLTEFPAIATWLARKNPEKGLLPSDPDAEARMVARIDEARSNGDTVGGIFEVVATGLPIGLGSYVHWDRRLDAALVAAVRKIDQPFRRTADDPAQLLDRSSANIGQFLDAVLRALGMPASTAALSETDASKSKKPRSSR